jgi:NAD(P)-dependent dehydrogenase (short-subunit alcohol dehydrogenase family)
MPNILDGKIALVTGCSSGIGRATSVKFASEGAVVTCADIDSMGGETTVAMIREAGGKADFVQTDVSDVNQVQALIGKIVSIHGRLNCAFNDAGIEGDVIETHESSERNFDRLMAINVKGVWLCLKYEIRQMLKQGGGGAIVNTASVAGLAGFPALSLYVASKHAVMALPKVRHWSARRAGIRINAVCPGPVDTPMMERIAGNEGRPGRQDFEAFVPMRRYADPGEVAQTVAWLCSIQASYVTGVAMPVDGGMVAS